MYVHVYVCTYVRIRSCVWACSEMSQSFHLLPLLCCLDGHRRTCTNVPAKQLINKIWMTWEIHSANLAMLAKPPRLYNADCKATSQYAGHARNSYVYCTTQLILNDRLSNHVKPALISQSSKSFHSHEHPLLSCNPCRQSIRTPRFPQFSSIQSAKCLPLTAIC